MLISLGRRSQYKRDTNNVLFEVVLCSLLSIVVVGFRDLVLVTGIESFCSMVPRSKQRARMVFNPAYSIRL